MDKGKTRYDFVYFILKTLYQIFYYSGWYCYFDDSKDNSKCKICTILFQFPNFENMFNVDILNSSYEKLC